MRTSAKIVGAIAGIAGIVQVVLGVIFWTGHLKSLIPLHMVVGLVFVLALWGLCGLGIAAGLALRSVLTFAWSLVVPILGVTQMGLLAGPFHWVIQVLHLLVGLIAMRLGRDLARLIAQRATPVQARRAPPLSAAPRGTQAS